MVEICSWGKVAKMLQHNECIIRYFLQFSIRVCGGLDIFNIKSIPPLLRRQYLPIFSIFQHIETSPQFEDLV